MIPLWLLVVCLPVAAGATDARVATENVTATLVSETRAVRPGATVMVGLHQDIRAGWHTYWKNPGDSGEATDIDWQLPEGVTVGPIQWPAPHRIPYDPLVNYGYEGEVLLASAVQVPADWPVGEPVRLQAEATWLVCADVCIPEQGSFSLEIPTVADPPLADPVWAPAFAAARAALPVDLPWPADAAVGPETVRLMVAAGDWRQTRPADVHFFPDSWGVIDHAGDQQVTQSDAGLALAMPVGSAPPVERLTGVLVVAEELDGGTVRRAFAVDAPIADAAAGGGVAPGAGPGVAGLTGMEGEVAGAAGGPGLVLALGLALIGGILLNLMPCVFPVLSMKAMGLVRHAQAGRGVILRDAGAYTAGVLAAFAAVAGALLAVKAGGAQIGWGFQLQSPVVVLLLAYLLFAVGLSLSGMLTVGNRLSGLGSGLASRSGPSGAFFTGVLATVVATPCTAPFMGAAVGFALTQHWAVALLVFQALGLGLALPYVALGLWPGLLRRLPRPGPWMDRLKQALAFPMYLSAAWLLWVLGRQTGVDGLAAALVGLVLIGFAVWLWRIAGETDRLWSRVSTALAALALVGALGVMAPLSQARSPSDAGDSGRAAAGAQETAWEPYSPARLAALRDEGRPVFVNMTAAWCITCLVNEQVALSSPAVLDAMEQAGIVYLKGDWTNRDPEITALLESFGRSGVPLYVFYPAGTGGDSTPRVLPQILTESVVRDALGLG
ncbi:MAG: thiol:disulfide interchange protein [Alphaproteobacteria bacterium]|nr:thiol:disulfide interchange protein [Alphaproteobacteria bacterium]